MPPPVKVFLSAELGAPAGTWQLAETEPGSGSWIVRRGGVRVGVVRRESTSRGRRAWLARLETGGRRGKGSSLRVRMCCWTSRRS